MIRFRIGLCLLSLALDPDQLQFYEHENQLIVLRGPLYFKGSMKHYGRVYGGGGHLQLLVKQVGGGERMGVDPNL